MTRRIAWTLIAFGGVLAVLSTVEKLPGAEVLGLHGVGAVVVEAARSAAGRAAITVATLALAARIVLTGGRSRAVLALFVLIFALAHVEAAADLPGTESVRHGKFLPGAILGVVALGRLLGRDDPDRGERRALGYAVGVAATLYGAAAVVKVATGGLDWSGNAGIGMLVYERSYAVPGAWSDLRRAFGTHPWLPAAGASVVMLVEALGVLLLVPRLRFAYAALATAMHVTIFVLLGYLYAEWWTCLWGLAFWTRAVERTSEG